MSVFESQNTTREASCHEDGLGSRRGLLTALHVRGMPLDLPDMHVCNAPGFAFSTDDLISQTMSNTVFDEPRPQDGDTVEGLGSSKPKIELGPIHQQSEFAKQFSKFSNTAFSSVSPRMCRASDIGFRSRKEACRHAS